MYVLTHVDIMLNWVLLMQVLKLLTTTTNLITWGNWCEVSIVYFGEGRWRCVELCWIDFSNDTWDVSNYSYGNEGGLYFYLLPCFNVELLCDSMMKYTVYIKGIYISRIKTQHCKRRIIQNKEVRVLIIRVSSLH